jgi:hypothetical protein
MTLHGKRLKTQHALNNHQALFTVQELLAVR